jgi:hypothetical protein
MQLNTGLTEKLYASFPHLYRGRHKPPEESSMVWGFQCGDGWYQLLYDLSLELSNYQTKHPELDLEVEQVKSKFGILRFHLSGGDAVTEKMIERACQRASVTCELTGQPGQHCVSPKRRFDQMVLCPEKAAELGYAPAGNQNSGESKNAH